MLVLNASYEPINVCTVRRAAVLILKNRAEILERSEWALHAESFTLPRPMVIRLKTYVRVPRDAHRRKGDRLPRQANMVPSRPPSAPNSTIFIHVAVPVIPQSWEQYIPQAA